MDIRRSSRGYHVWLNAALGFGVLLTLGSCSSPRAKRKHDGGSGAQAPIVLYQENPFAQNARALETAFGNSASQITADANTVKGLDESSLWALAQCRCTPQFAGLYFAALARSRGTLPQPLVPAVREEVKSNSALRAVASLPPGIISSVANSLIGWFMGDDKLNKQIRDGMQEKLSKSLNGGTQLKSNLEFFFELYPSPYVNLGNKEIFAPKNMDVRAQSSKWTFVLAQPNMWGTDNAQTNPLRFGDHGLQLLLTAQTLSEWTYAFGLDKDSQTQMPYGGLTIAPKEGLNDHLKPFDPRLSKGTPARIITGVYDVKFPISDAIQLATQVKEEWSRQTRAIDLDEQSRVWTAAAMAYMRLRPANRDASAQFLFTPGSGMFPADAHNLALAFLPGMSELLSQQFLNQKSLDVYEIAAVPGTTDPDAKRSASLLSSARLAFALNLWLGNLKDLEKDNLSPDIRQQLESSRNTIKDALRLAVAHIISNYTSYNVPGAALNGDALIKSIHTSELPPLGTAAEVLAILATIEQQAFATNSGIETTTDLHRKIVGLFHWFTAQYMAPLAMGKNLDVKPGDLFWTHAALKAFAVYDAQTTSTAWNADLQKIVSGSVAQWDRRGGP